MRQWLIRSKLKLRNWLPTVLIVSLSLNLLLVGGFLYQRFIVQPRLQSEWAIESLHLNDQQQTSLRQLNVWSRVQIKQMLDELAPEIAVTKRCIREGNIADPAFQTAMRRISERRLSLQIESLAHVLAFRDSLNPEQLKIFQELSERPRFVQQLLGLTPQSKQPVS